MTVVSLNVKDGMIDCRMVEPVPVRVFLNSVRAALVDYRKEETPEEAPYIEVEECEE